MDTFKRRGKKYSRITYRLPRKCLDEDVALLLGLHVGDGWLSDKWGIMCKKIESSMINWIIRLAREVLGVEPMIGEYKESEIMIRSGQRQVLDFFRDYGLPQGRKAGKVWVPKQILGSDDSAITKAFLRGLFSTDGCFSFQNSRFPHLVRCEYFPSLLQPMQKFESPPGYQSDDYRSYLPC